MQELWPCAIKTGYSLDVLPYSQVLDNIWRAVCWRVCWPGIRTVVFDPTARAHLLLESLPALKTLPLVLLPRWLPVALRRLLMSLLVSSSVSSPRRLRSLADDFLVTGRACFVAAGVFLLRVTETLFVFVVTQTPSSESSVSSVSSSSSELLSSVSSSSSPLSRSSSSELLSSVDSSSSPASSPLSLFLSRMTWCLY